jgi:regulator of protease activity HflC (stomatin/prohibitin superfamily)
MLDLILQFKKTVFAVFFSIILLMLSGNLYENLDAEEIMVLQMPGSGELKVFTTPGWKWQLFGTVTKYPLRAEYKFDTEDTSKLLQFNDGGNGYMYGSVSWKMPTDEATIIALHRAYKGVDRIQREAVAGMIDSAIFLAGPLMSSTESVNERRAELVRYIHDQATNGVYVTTTKSVKTSDAMTGDETVARISEIVLDKDGNPQRQQTSVLRDFGITLLPLAITKIDYDKTVEDQIKKRQEAITNVQLSKARATEAQQNTITAEEEGKAAAARAKWAEEANKATAVTVAEKERDVAKLGAEAASFTKQRLILEGQGEAEKKRLVMSANGNMETKIEAWKAVNFKFADAFAAYKGDFVPKVVMGQQGSGASSAQNFMDLMMVKTAKDLGLDMSVEK